MQPQRCQSDQMEYKDANVENYDIEYHSTLSRVDEDQFQDTDITRVE